MDWTCSGSDLFNKHPHSQFGTPMYVLKTQNSANFKMLSPKKWPTYIIKFNE